MATLPYPSPYVILKTDLVLGDTLGTALSGSSGIDNRPHKEIQANVDYLSSFIYKGAGSPEGIVIANIGSLYLRTDGSTNTTLYIKESGTSSTGWIPK